jgi:hypothetical protein
MKRLPLAPPTRRTGTHIRLVSGVLHWPLVRGRLDLERFRSTGTLSTAAARAKFHKPPPLVWVSEPQPPAKRSHPSHLPALTRPPSPRLLPSAWPVVRPQPAIRKCTTGSERSTVMRMDGRSSTRIGSPGSQRVSRQSRTLNTGWLRPRLYAPPCHAYHSLLPCPPPTPPCAPSSWGR